MSKRFQMMGLLLVFMALGSASCTRKSAQARLDSERNTTFNSSFAPQIRSEADFVSLQRVNDGFSFVKFSNFFKEPGSPIYFQNTQKFPFHLEFFRSVIPRLQSLNNEQYELMMFDPAAREVFAGALYYAPEMEVAGIEGKGILGFNLYSKGRISPEDVAQTAARFKEMVPFAQGRIVFLFDKIPDFFKYRNALQQKGVPSIPIGRFLNQGISARVYHSAKSYGYLKILSAEEAQAGDYSSKDILLLEDAPLDLGPVSGVVTTKPQPPHSHIIFRAVNMKIPCAFLPGAIEQLSKAVGQLVEVETTADNKVFVRTAADLGESALQQVAEDYFRSRVPVLPKPPLDLSRREIVPLPLKSVDKTLVASYGAKATNFGLLDEALRSEGEGRSYFDGAVLLPMSFYDEHLRQKLSTKVCEKSLDKCKKTFATSCQPAADLWCDRHGRKRMGASPISALEGGNE